MSQGQSQKNLPIHTGQLRSIDPSRLRRLLEASTDIGSYLEQTQILKVVVRAASDLTDTERAYIYLIEASFTEMYLAASTADPLVEEQAAIPLDGTVVGWIAENRAPLILHDSVSLNEFQPIQFESDVTANDLMAVPLMYNDRVIGVIEVLNKYGNETFSDQDEALLEILASQATIALENARLFQQSDLIAEFMHELKTPLMALTAASEIMAREGLPPFQLELLTMIQSETERLSRMAQDFLDLARLEFGRSSDSRRPVDMAALVEDVAILQKPEATLRNISIICEAKEGLPLVMGDHDQLKQVILNLTNNAIKYNKVGGSIDIRLYKDPQYVVVEIADTGRGIAPEYMPHLFERFFRVKDDAGRTEGTGLGLPIAKRILENHGGKIEVESVLNQGTTFRCYLPYDVALSAN